MELQQLNELLPPTLRQCNVSCRSYWKDISGKYGSGTGLFIGKILVATYSFNGIRPKGAVNEDYVVTSFVPGIKSMLGKYGTVEECQARCIEVVQHFLRMLGDGS